MANGSFISCGNVANVDWNEPVGVVQTCKVATSLIISEDTALSTRNETVKGIDFWGNKGIKFLPVKVSESFPNLLAYGAGMCSLTKISKANFKNMSKLKVLFLYRNQITTINSDTFEDLVALEWLDLREQIIFNQTLFLPITLFFLIFFS